MKRYSRHIENIMISILIDESIWEKEYKVFNSLFRSFELPEEISYECGMEYFYYIYDKETSISKIEKNINFTVCDTYTDNWIFLLMHDLEVFYSSIMKCTIIHGSCVKINGKNILLIGERRSGKTTLTKYLTISKNGEYLDDDCVYIMNDSYIGFNMPLPMRNITDYDVNNFWIGQTVDTDNIQRSLYSPPHCVNSLQKMDIIAFPKYIADGGEVIKKMTQGEAFNQIVKNVRSHDHMKTMFTDIKKLVLTTDCYCLEYSSSDSAYNLLFS